MEAANYNPELTALIVKFGGNIKAVGQTETVLHESYDERIIDLYARAGGDLNKADNNLGTPIAQWINFAMQCETNSRERCDNSRIKNAIIKLISYGADINARNGNAMHEIKRMAKLNNLDLYKSDMYNFLKSIGARD